MSNLPRLQAGEVRHFLKKIIRLLKVINYFWVMVSRQKRIFLQLNSYYEL